MCPIVPPNIIEFPSSGWALFEIPQFDKIRPTDRARSQNAGHHSTDGWLSLVEGTGFENRRRGNSSGGSNPSPSAFLRVKSTSLVLLCCSDTISFTEVERCHLEMSRGTGKPAGDGTSISAAKGTSFEG